MTKKVTRFSSTIDNQLGNIQDPNSSNTLSPDEIANGVQNRMGTTDVKYGQESDQFGLVTQQLANQQTSYTTPTVIGIGNLPGPKKMGESKYDFGLRMEDAIDIDETRGQRQTNWDKFGNGVIKNLLGKTATNVLGGTVGTVYGLGSALINMDFDKMYDNEFARVLDDANEFMDGKMPAYYTRAEQHETSLLKRMGSANFIFDQVTNGFSFLAGAVLTEMAAAAVAIPTGGASLIANHARLTSQAARLLKVADRSRRMTALGGMYKQAANSKALVNSLKIGRQILTGANYESGIEARAHYDELMEGLQEDWKKQPENAGVDIPQEKMDEFEIQARKTANAVYGVNLALVGGSNMLMIPQLYGPGAILKGKMLRGMNKLGLSTGRQTGKVVGKEGTKAVGKYASMGKLGNFLGMGEKTQRVLGKTGQNIGLLRTPAYEGFVEEGLQSTIGSAAYDYGMMATSSESKKATADWISSVYYGLHETYMNADGQSEIALGAILGLIGLPGVSGGIISEAKDMKAKRTVQDLIAQRYNDNPGMLQSMQNSGKFFTEQQQLVRLMDEALMDNNMAAFKDIEHDYFFGYVKSRHEAGFFEDIIEDADAVRDMSDQEFIKFTGYNANDFTGKGDIEARKNKVADSAIARANKIKKSLDIASDALGGTNPDVSHMHTNEQWRTVRDRVAHQLSVAENVEERMDALKESLAEKTGGKLVVQEREGEVLSPGIRFQTLSEKGSPMSVTIPFINMTKPTLNGLIRSNRLELDADAQLKEGDTNKLTADQRAVIELQIAVAENAIGEGLDGEITSEEREFLSLALGETSENKHLTDLFKEDPVQFAKEIDSILDTLKDMRHLRARRQTAIQDYNALMDPKNQQQYIQKLERFVEDSMKEDVPQDIIDRTGDKEVAELFRQFGTTTEFRPHTTYKEKDVEVEEEGRVLQFDEFGNLYDINDPGAKVLYKSLYGIGLDRITTQDQREARKALQAIKNIQENDKSKLERVLIQIKETEDLVFKELIELEETYGTEKEIEEQVQTGRKKGKFLSKKYLGELKEVRDKVIDTIETGEALIKEYELEARELEESIEYLQDLMVAHYNPRGTYELTEKGFKQTAGSFDISLDNRFIAERLTRLEIMSNELGIDIDPESQDAADLEAAQAYVTQITQDLGEYINQTDSTIKSLSARLGDLKEYQDILEKTLFDRLKQNKNLVLNKHVMSNNMDDVFNSIVSEISNYVESEEGREEYMSSEENPYRDEVLNPGESTVATKRQQLELLKELPSYKAYRDFVNQNDTAFFWELRDFLGQLDTLESDMNDIKFLKQELKSTREEVAEVKELLDSVIKDRKTSDPEQQLRHVELVSQAIQYEQAYNKILPEITKMEMELLTPIAENTSEETTDPVSTNIGVRGPQIDGMTDVDFNKQYDNNEGIHGKRYRRSWADNPFNGTAGDQTTNLKILNDLATPESLLGKGDPVLKEGGDPIAFKQALYGATWYKYTSGYLNYKSDSKGEVGLMAVHSNNVGTLSEDMQEELKDLFVEEEVTPEGADIKLILVDKKSGKPKREKNSDRLIVTSMMLPYSEFEGSDKYTRFTNELEVDPEVLDEIVESALITRGDILKESESKTILNIRSASPGYSRRSRNAEGAVQVYNASGRLFGTNQPQRAAKIKIVIPVLPNADGSSQIEHAGVTFYAGLGMPQAIDNGNVHPLRVRTINKTEAENIILLLRRQEKQIAELALEGITSRGEAFKAVQGRPLLGEDGAMLSEKSYHDILNDLIFTGSPKDGASGSAMKYQFYYNKDRKGYVFGNNGFISISDVLKNDAESIEKLRTFLVGDGGQNGGKTLHTNNQTLKKATTKTKELTPFEEIIFKELDDGTIALDVEKSKLISNKSNWKNYNEYLLSSSAEMGRSTDNVPPLRVSMPLMSTSVLDTQVDYRYIKYDLQSAKKKSTPITNNNTNPNPKPPSGVVYTEIQKKDIVETENLLNLASKGQKIEVLSPTDTRMLVSPTVSTVLMNFISESIGGAPGQQLGLKKDATVQDAVDKVRGVLEKYKANTYAMDFVRFINAIAEGKTPPSIAPADIAKEKTSRDEQIDKATEIPENTDDGVVIPDFTDMLDEITKKVEELDPNNLITPIERTAEENREARDKRKAIIKGISLEGLEDGTAESLITVMSEKEQAANIKERERDPSIAHNMNLMLPKVNIEYVTEFMKTNNGVAQGRVTEFGKIMIANMAQSGTEYHEAYHQVSLYLLPKQEAQELFNEVRTKNGEFITFKGVQKKFSEATNKEADEWLAEEFRRTMISGGNYAVGSNKVKNWFEKLLDFIVSVVTLGVYNNDTLDTDRGIIGSAMDARHTRADSYKMAKIAKFFDRIRNSEFADSKPHPNAIGGTAESLTLGSTVKFDMDMISTLDYYFADSLLNGKDGIHLADLGNLGNKEYNKKFNKKLLKAYETSIGRMLEILNDVIDSPTATPQQKLRAERNFGTLGTNFKTLVEMHREHLRDIGLNFEVNYEDLAEDEIARIDKDSASNMFNAMEFSTRDMAPSIIKFLISTLPSGTINDSTQLNDSADFADTMNFMQDKLAGTQSLEEQINILKATKKAWVKPLLQRLGVIDGLELEGKNIKDVIVQNEFFGQFAKQKNDFITQMIDSEGNIYSVDTNKTRLNELIADPWKNNLLSDPNGIAKVENGEIVIDPTKQFTIAPGVKASIRELYENPALNKLIKGENALTFLKNLGIVFTNPSRLLSTNADISDEQSNVDILNESTGWIIKELNKPKVLGIQANIFSNDNLDASGRLGSLMKLEALDNDTAIELQHFTPDGKVVYGITLNTYLSIVANSNGGTKGISKYLDPTHNIYTRNSRLVKSLAEGADMRILVQQGTAIAGIGDRGIKTEKLSPSDQMSGIVNDTLNGKARFLRAADQSVEYVIGMPGGAVSLDMTADIFRGYLTDELAVSQSRRGKEFARFRDASGLRFFKRIVGDIVNEKMHIDLRALEEGKGVGTPVIEEFMAKYWTQTILPTVQKYFDNQSIENLGLWEKHKLIERQSNGQYTILGIDRALATKITGETADTYSRSQILKLAKHFSVNYMSNNIEQFKVFLGDPAFYKGLFKRTKMSAGTKELSRVDKHLDSWLNEPANMRSDGRNADGTEEVMVFNDPVVISDYLQEYKKILGANAKAYEEIEEADAAAFATLDAYREFSIRTSDWSPIQEQLYWQITMGEKNTLTRDELASFPVKKPQYMGPQVTSDGQFAPFGMKISLAPLLPHLLKDPNTGEPTQLSKLNDNLNSESVGIAMFPSGTKFGNRVNPRTGKGTDLYNKNGLIADVNPANISTIDYKFFGKQQNISPATKQYTTVGTQKRTLMKSDLFEGGVPVDYLENYDVSERMMMWNKLAENSKLAQSPVYKQIKEYDNLYNGLTVQARTKLLKRFGITEENGEYKVKDNNYKEFGKLVKSEMSRRNMPRSLKDGVEWILEESPEKLFDMLINKGRLESLLFSLINNKILSQKMVGDMAVQSTSTGMEVEARAIKQVGSKTMLSSGSSSTKLKFYEMEDWNNPGSKTTGMEVFLPNFFKEYLGENLIIRPDGVYNEEGKLVADTSLLDVIGFRIPTDGLHSIEFIKVKGFLSKDGGSQVIVPSETPAKTGSDYDIDKLSIYLPSSVRRNGVLTKRTMVMADPSTPEGLKKHYDALYGPTLNFFKELDRQLAEASDSSEAGYDPDTDSLLKSIFGEDALEYTEEELDLLKSKFKSLENSSDDAKLKFAEEEYEKLKERIKSIPSFEEWKKENKGKSLVELNHTGAIQNRIMEISKEILEHPRSRYSLLNPISTDRLGYDNGLAGDIRTLKGLPRRPDSMDYADMISLTNVAKVTETFLVGKENVGIEAVNVTHHIKAQQAGLYIRPNQIIEKFGNFYEAGIFLEGFEDTTQGGAISLSNIYSLDGDMISDSLSQFVNAFIDVANDPFIFELNFNPTTSNAWNLLVRSGVPIQQAAYFMNQPVILEFVEKSQVNSSKFLQAKNRNASTADILKELKADLEGRIVSDYKYHTELNSSIASPKTFSLETLEAGIGQEYSEMTQDQLKDQLQILNNYEMYGVLGGELTALVQSSSQDTKKINSRAHAKIAEAKYAHTMTTGIFGNIDNMFKDTLMEEFRNTHLNTYKMFNSLFFTENEDIKTSLALNNIEQVFTNPKMMKGVDGAARAIQKAENDAIMYLLAGAEIDGVILGDKIQRFFTGEDSMAKRLSIFKSEGSDNMLINKLIPLISIKQDGTLMSTDNIKLVSKILNTYDQNVLLDSWHELYGNPGTQQFANDLLDFALLQSGLNNSPIAFVQYLPSDIYARRAAKVFKQFENKNEASKNKKSDFFDKFFQNNWSDPNIVPRLFGEMNIKTGKPSIGVGLPKGEYPYVAAMKPDYASVEDKKWYEDNNMPVPKKLVLFKRTTKHQYKDKSGNTRWSWNYVEAQKFGNGMQLTEYTNADEASVLPSNNPAISTSTTRSQDIPLAMPQLNKGELEQIKAGKKIQISGPKNKLRSGLYALSNGVKIRVEASKPITLGELDTLGKKDLFAQNEGYKNWDSLVSKIRRTQIPVQFLDGLREIDIFAITDVIEPALSVTSIENQPEATVIINQTVKPQDLDGFGKSGPLTQLFQESMSKLIDEQIAAGKRNFVVGMGHGTDLITVQMLRNKQLNLADKNIKIRIRAVLPYVGLENTFSPKDKVLFDQYINAPRATLLRDGNEIRYTSKKRVGFKLGQSITKTEALKLLQTRNRDMAKLGTTILGAYEGDGGNMIKQAEKDSKKIIKIDLAELKEISKIKQKLEEDSQNCNS